MITQPGIQSIWRTLTNISIICCSEEKAWTCLAALNIWVPASDHITKKYNAFATGLASSERPIHITLFHFWFISFYFKKKFPWVSGFIKSLDFHLPFWRQEHQWRKLPLLHEEKKTRVETKSWPHARHWQSSLTQGNPTFTLRPFCQLIWTQSVIADILKWNERQTQWQPKGNSNQSPQVFLNCCCVNFFWKEIPLRFPPIVVIVFLSFTTDTMTDILSTF